MGSVPAYVPRAPQEGVLAPLVRQWWPRYVESVQAEGKSVPTFVDCGAVVVIQRFTKALTVYPHLHVLVLDGGYVQRDDETLDFVEVAPPASRALRRLEADVEERFTRWLQRHGFLEDEPEPLKPEDEWWTAAAREPSGLLARVDPRRGRGFEVHAAVRVAAEDAEGRLRLARYVLRPPFAEAQLERWEDEHERVRLTFRTPTRTGQRFLDLHPMALMRRLAWLVPPPRQHPIRYAGVLAPAAPATRHRPRRSRRRAEGVVRWTSLRAR